MAEHLPTSPNNHPTSPTSPSAPLVSPLAFKSFVGSDATAIKGIILSNTHPFYQCFSSSLIHMHVSRRFGGMAWLTDMHSFFMCSIWSSKSTSI
jgi:hypothetical protein